MKVAIIYPYFAHYRYPVIDVLASDSDIEYHFLGGVTSVGRVKDLKLVDFSTRKNFTPLKNIWFLKYFLWQNNLLSELKRNKYDAVIIFADWKYITTWFAIFYLRLRKTPVMFWSHGFWEYKRDLNNFIKLQYFKLFKDGGFVYDNRAKDVFNKMHYKNDIEIIYNSLDFDYQTKILQEIIDEKHTEKDYLDLKPYIVFSGRLTAIKKINLLLESMKTLKSENIDLNLVLIGEGVQKEYLKRLAKNYSIEDRIIFFGSCYDEKIIGNFFYHSIASVIPSGVGLSAIHSLTYGVPVITNDNNLTHGPEIEALIDNYNSKFFIEDNAESLAEQIKFFLNLSEEDRSIFNANAINIIRDKFNPQYQSKILKRRIISLAKG